MAGYEASPFHPDAQFWVRNPNVSDRVARRIIAALRVMIAEHKVLVPAGFMPKDKIATMRQEMRGCDLKQPQIRRGFLEHVLGFSGPLAILRFDHLYREEESFYQKVHDLERPLNYIEQYVQSVLRAQGMTEEEMEPWRHCDWPEFDLIRTIAFMADRGMVFDDEKNKWIPR